LSGREPRPLGRALGGQARERLLRDPVHGLIAIDESTAEGRLLVGLIDSPEFQRLRRIRQLGLACVAFHGAEHSRFNHSIGAFHLAREMLEQLGRRYGLDRELILSASVAALLHDLGHGPFSHVWERRFGRPHEAWTVRLLHDERTVVHGVLAARAPNFPSIIEAILCGRAKPGYLASVVSGQLDADRMDYLLRDGLMTGVKYGVFDLDRLLHMLRISEDGERIVIARAGLGPIEKYVQARYHMFRQVYLHKTVVAAEAMLMALLGRAGDLLARGEAAGLDPASPLGRALGRPEELDVPEHLALDDVEVLAQLKRWRSGPDAILTDLATRLLDRRLFKTLEIDPGSPDFAERLAEARARMRAHGLPPEYYLLREDSSDTPYAPYNPEDPRSGERILIETREGGLVDVAQVSPTLRAFTQSSYTLSRLVFPERADDWDARAELERLFEGNGA